MKYAFFAVCLLVFKSVGLADITIYGNTDYSFSNKETLITKINSEYKIKILETACKSYMTYIGGTISHDVDHFGKTIRTNCFTNIGIEF